MSAPVASVAFDFRGVERSITGDPVTKRLTLWDGTDITGMSGQEVEDLIWIKTILEGVERAKRRRRSRVGGWLRALSGEVL